MEESFKSRLENKDSLNILHSIDIKLLLMECNFYFIYTIPMKNWQTQFLILLCFFSYTSFAQSRIRLGPEVALAVNFYPKTDLGSNALLSSHVGIKTTYALKNHFSISTGIFFTQKKIQYTKSYTEPTPSLNNVLTLLASSQNFSFDPNKALNTDSKITINGLATAQFIEIPVLYSYEREGVVFSSGPYLGILASVKDKQIKETTIPFVETVNYSEIAGGTGGALLTLLSPKAYSKEETTARSTSQQHGKCVGMYI